MMGLETGEHSQNILSSPSSVAGSDSQAVIFYGVLKPHNSSVVDVNDGVFVDKKEALLAVKNNREARFKAFKTYEEALSFSKNTTVQLNNSHSREDGEFAFVTRVDSNGLLQLPAKTFRGPKAQDLVKLRKMIEKGNGEDFSLTVWDNPRFLISSGDTPTILHEGPRYNALHIAAKFKQPSMCQLILEIVEDSKFMQLLYNDDTQEIRIKRINNLVDLYLNMPDKGCCETPLHFAAKFGCYDIVNILASHPACDKELRNKFDQTARDIAGSRCPFADVRKKIENSLEDHYFVPVLSTEDNTCQPFVGEPFSPHDASSLSPLRSPSLHSPLQPSLVVRAVAGPMSPIQAKDLHRIWKKPAPMIKSSTPLSGRHILLGIRLSDTEKGLERIGRELAEELRVPWREKWQFLDEFCDLSKPDGLSKLETYLRNTYNVLFSQVKPIIQQATSYLEDYMPDFDETLNSVFDSSDLSKVSLNSSVSSLCRAFKKLKIYCSPGSDHSHSLDKRLPHQRQSCRPKGCTKDHRSTPPRLQEITSMHILDQVCLDISNHVSFELCERIVQGKGKEIKLDFVDKISPGVECLLRVAKHSLLINKENTECKGLHLKIAKHVDDNMKDGFVADTFCDFPHGVNGTKPFIITSESEDDSVDEDFSRWRGYTCNRSTMKEITQRHLKCILSNVVLLMKEDFNGQCLCNWMRDFALSENIDKGKYDLHNQEKLFIENNSSSSPASSSQKEHKERPTSGNATEISLEKGKSDCTSFYGQSSCDGDAVSDDSTDFYVTPPSSFLSSRNSSFSDAHTPDEGIAVFINGSQPTKLDLDVLRALEKLTIDPVIYPHISRWHHLVSTYSRDEIERWPTPSSLKLRRTMPLRSLNSFDAETSPLKSLSHCEDALEDNSIQKNLYKSVFANLMPE